MSPTSQGVEYVAQAQGDIAATITTHHLMINRNHILAGGIRPHYYCLPVAKRATHQQALRRAATSGNPRFFLGTDSAPHSDPTKESACGCAGVFSATKHAVMPRPCVRGGGRARPARRASPRSSARRAYGLAPNDATITLEKARAARGLPGQDRHPALAPSPSSTPATRSTGMSSPEAFIFPQIRKPGRPPMIPTAYPDRATMARLTAPPPPRMLLDIGAVAFQHRYPLHPCQRQAGAHLHRLPKDHLLPPRARHLHGFPVLFGDGGRWPRGVRTTSPAARPRASPFAAFVAERLGLPMSYVRKQPKGYGRTAQIEGEMREGERVLLVEDLYPPTADRS